MDRLEKPNMYHRGTAMRVIPVGLVGPRRKEPLGVPRINAEDRVPRFRQSSIDPLRKRTGLQSDRVLQSGKLRQKRGGFGGQRGFEDGRRVSVEATQHRFIGAQIQSDI